MTGHWRGHYEQSGRCMPIEMIVWQTADSMCGQMLDGITDPVVGSQTYDPLAGALVVVSGEAIVSSELPPISSIEGTVHGSVVRFVKHYQGPTQVTMRIAGRAEYHVERPGHRVRYEGELDAAGEVLRGHWTIPAGATGTALDRDRFELRRVRGS